MKSYDIHLSWALDIHDQFFLKKLVSSLWLHHYLLIFSFFTESVFLSFFCPILLDPWGILMAFNFIPMPELFEFFKCIKTWMDPRIRTDFPPDLHLVQSFSLCEFLFKCHFQVTLTSRGLLERPPNVCHSFFSLLNYVCFLQNVFYNLYVYM